MPGSISRCTLLISPRPNAASEVRHRAYWAHWCRLPTSLQAYLVAHSVGAALGQELAVSLTGLALSATFNAFAGLLEVSGSGTAASYAEAIRRVTYVNRLSSPTTGTRM